MIVRFDKLNPVIGAAMAVPVIGDIMASAGRLKRWRLHSFGERFPSNPVCFRRGDEPGDVSKGLVDAGGAERIDRSERLLKAGKRDKATQSSNWSGRNWVLKPRYRLATATFLQGNAGEANMAAIERPGIS